jgi:hypothetical protein
MTTETVDPCWVCGSTEAVEISMVDELTGHEQSVLVCADCGDDQP